MTVDDVYSVIEDEGGTVSKAGPLLGMPSADFNLHGYQVRLHHNYMQIVLDLSKLYPRRHMHTQLPIKAETTRTQFRQMVRDCVAGMDLIDCIEEIGR